MKIKDYVVHQEVYGKRDRVVYFSWLEGRFIAILYRHPKSLLSYPCPFCDMRHAHIIGFEGLRDSWCQGAERSIETSIGIVIRGDKYLLRAWDKYTDPEPMSEEEETLVLSKIEEFQKAAKISI